MRAKVFLLWSAPAGWAVRLTHTAPILPKKKKRKKNILRTASDIIKTNKSLSDSLESPSVSF